MADNKQSGAAVGSGPTFATDEIGGIDYPRAKVVWGVDGTATDASASNPLPVVQTGTPALPTGASTAAKQPALGTAGTSSADVLSVQGVSGGTALPVSGTFYQATQPVSAATLPLPSGAATAAKQPALGTAGTSSADVLSVQGIASGTAMPVSLASVPSHAVTNAGTFATQESGAALTALQLIDNLVLAEDAAAASGDPGVAVLAVRRDSAASGVSADGDYANLSVDSTGALRVTGGGGGTQYAEDTAHVSGDTGTLNLAVRRDANTSLVDATGDYAPLQVDATGSLKVAIISGAGSGGTSATDDAAFSVASGSGTPIMGLADETSPDSVDEGDVGVVRMTLPRALHVNLRDASGNELSAGAQYAEDAAHTTGDLGTLALARRSDSAASSAGTDGDYATLNTDSSGRLWVNASGAAVPVTDNSGSLTVDNGGTFAVQATVAAGATNIAKAEDVASADADVGVPAMAVRKASPANSSGTDGDYEMLQMSAGRLWVDPSGVTLTVASHAVTNAGTFATQAGQAAHDAAVAGNPVRTAARAGTADYTAVADGDTADILSTILGKQVFQPYALPANTWNYAAPAGGLVNTTGVTAKAAAGAGVRNYITAVQVINSHATISTEVVIRDGAAGTVLHRGWAQAAGGGYTCKFEPPLRGTANTLVEIAEVSNTATAGVLVNLQGYSAAE